MMKSITQRNCEVCGSDRLTHVEEKLRCRFRAHSVHTHYSIHNTPERAKVKVNDWGHIRTKKER